MTAGATERHVPSRDRERSSAPPASALGSRAAAAVVALTACVWGFVLAWHHPLAPQVVTGAFVLACALAWRDRTLWLAVVPALLPVLSFAPWTGWLTFEEVDLLVLAVIAGGQARRALSGRATLPAERSEAEAGAPGAVRLAVAVFVVCTGVSLARGVADAGGFHFGWYQGYHEPMNSLRIAKGPFFALLLWPLWLDAARAEPQRAHDRLRTGLMLGLGAASLAAVWERAAFPGLLDFSSDYRTTALFWEMHVGGAALDGFLALTLPFATLGLLNAPRAAEAVRPPSGTRKVAEPDLPESTPSALRRRDVGLAATVVALGAYACLTTFSRGVYLAIPIGLLVFTALRLAGNPVPPMPGRRTGLWIAVARVAVFMGAVAWTFPSSGYRGALALWFGVALLLALADLPASLAPRDKSIGLGGGMLLSAAGLLLEALAPKGVYVASAAAALLGAVSWWRLRGSGGTSRPAAAGLLAAAVWSLVAWWRVAGHWGGEPASRRALPVAIALGIVVLATVCRGGFASRKTPGSAGPRWQAATLGAMVIAGGIVAVFTGGAYMTDRFSTSGDDFEVRLQHWREGVALLSGPGDWWLGRGLGRYPAADYIARLGAEHPGDFRLESTAGVDHLVLAAGQQLLGYGELLRISQRVGVPGASPTVRLDLRAPQPVQLTLEVCEKQLLYSSACQAETLDLPSSGTAWREIRTRLDGPPVSRGDWWAPRQLVFSIALGTPSTVADIAGIELIDPTGKQLLANGDFSHGMAHWFFSSDRYHLPWHIKNMALDLLLDQGLAGLGLVAVLVAAALWRLAFGAARRHPLAPALAASLIGFLVVGLFDSLLDVPRDALLFYLLTFVGLGLSPGRRHPA